MLDLISIIVPVYNGERYLEECLKSLAEQTYKNIEIILVDDGSTDSSGKICDAWTQKDSRIAVYHRANQGVSAARNYGIEKSNGKYLMFVDSDDWVREDIVELLHKGLAENNTDMACCGLSMVCDGVVGRTIVANEELVCDAKDTIKTAIERKHMGVGPYCKLFLKSLFDEIKFPVGQACNEDVAIIYRLIDRCSHVYFLPKVCYYYRQNTYSVTKQEYSHKFDDILKTSIDNEKFIKNTYPQLNKLIYASTAYSCLQMMIKILKTQNGYEEYKKEYNKNRKALLKRLVFFVFSSKCTLKQFVWMIICLCENRQFNRIYKKTGII